MLNTSRKPPQPTKAASWLRKVAEGATLKAISVGSTIARQAENAQNNRCRESTEGVTGSTLDDEALPSG